MENETIELVTVVPSWIQLIRLVISGFYRLVVSGGALFIIYSGQSAWVILAAIPLLVLGPRSR